MVGRRFRWLHLRQLDSAMEIGSTIWGSYLCFTYRPKSSAPPHIQSGLSSSVLANRKTAAWFCDVSWLIAQFNFAVGSVGIGQNMASKTGIGQNMACQTGSVRPNPWQASFKLIRLFWWDSSDLNDEFLVAEFPTP